MKLNELWRRHPSELLTVQEVCLVLKVSRRTLYRLIKAGKLPAMKVGGQYRFRLAEIRNYYQAVLYLVPLLFKPEVLNRYETPTEHYQLQSLAEGGGYLKFLGRGDPQEGLPDTWIRYHYRKLPDDTTAIMLTPTHFRKIPVEEIPHWRGYEIE